MSHSCRWRRQFLLSLTGLSGVLVPSFAGLTALGADDERKAPFAQEPRDEVGRRVYIWQEENKLGKFVPSGWMPDGVGIAQNEAETDNPHSKPHCLRLGCQLSAKTWVGVTFLLEGTWEPKEPFDMLAKLNARQGDPIRCRFWAASKDRPHVQFKVGGVTKGMVKDSLSFPVASPWIRLEPGWRLYEIDLTGKDLSSLVGGFLWVCDRMHNDEKDVSFDLDDIYFVKVKAKGK